MFKPNYTITPGIASDLMKIEALRQEIDTLPINSVVLASLRETARIESIHYSTFIEGNRLTSQQVKEVIEDAKNFPGRERDEKEVWGYDAALDYLKNILKKKIVLSEATIKALHALVMGDGKKKVTATSYRDGQNIIRDSATRRIVYLPPEAKDVQKLMKDLVTWVNKTEKELPCPLRAALMHYQFATIHPYFDGNGRTARLLTSFLLHAGGYGLKGLYSLEEYYANNLPAYYHAISIGPSHNYYEGREEADITPWVEYFCAGLVHSFERVKLHAQRAQKKGLQDSSGQLSRLDVRQQKALQLFKKKDVITAHDVEKAFKVQPRTARAMCQQWVQNGFFVVLDPSKKKRLYSISPAVLNY